MRKNPGRKGDAENAKLSIVSYSLLLTLVVRLKAKKGKNM
jgi:hypothetical protein